MNIELRTEIHPEFTERKRGDLGYGWLVNDNIKRISESIGFYKSKIECSDTPLTDKEVFKLACKKLLDRISLWRMEEEFCKDIKNIRDAYSLKG